jgi:hypothetical protein
MCDRPNSLWAFFLRRYRTISRTPGLCPSGPFAINLAWRSKRNHALVQCLSTKSRAAKPTTNSLKRREKRSPHAFGPLPKPGFESPILLEAARLACGVSASCSFPFRRETSCLAAPGRRRRLVVFFAMRTLYQKHRAIQLASVQETVRHRAAPLVCSHGIVPM